MAHIMMMDESIKVALAYKAGQQCVAKVWRFLAGHLVLHFSSVKKEIVEYFPYIAAKNLGDKFDPFVGFKICRYVVMFCPICIY